MPRPVRRPGQALLRVSAAGLNPVAFKLRREPVPELLIPLPSVVGYDVAGTVVAAASSSSLRVGDRVVSLLPFLLTGGWGACAEYVAVDADLLAPAPDDLPPSAAASLPLVGLTVLQAFEPVIKAMGGEAAMRGKRILVQAGAGGLGSFAVQYAAHVLHMEVTATCSEGNAEFVRLLGASATHDYKGKPFDEAFKGAGFDVVFDPLAYMYRNRTLRAGVVKSGAREGHYIAILGSPWQGAASPFGFIADFCQIIAANTAALVSRGPCVHGPVAVRPDGAMLRRVVSLVDKGVVRPVVEEGNIYPLERVVDAHERMEDGHVRGKLAILVRERDEWD